MHLLNQRVWEALVVRGEEVPDSAVREDIIGQRRRRDGEQEGSVILGGGGGGDRTVQVPDSTVREDIIGQRRRLDGEQEGSVMRRRPNSASAPAQPKTSSVSVADVMV